MQYIKYDFNHPFIQPFLEIFKFIIIDKFPVEVTSFLQALLLASIKHPMATFLKFETFPLHFNYTEIMIVGIITLIKYFGYLILWMIIIRYIIFLIYPGNHPAVHIVSELTKVIIVPIKNLFKIKISIDIYYLFLILILYMFNYIGIILLPEIWRKL
ncbi:MAG: hypothetical protein V6003_02570 [Candidatus Dasytiphilus stammeri]